MSYYYEVFLSVIICQHNRKFSKYGCYRQLWLFQNACIIKLSNSISIMFIEKWWFFYITHRIVFHRPIVHNILKLIKDDICIKKNRKSKLWDIGAEQLFSHIPGCLWYKTIECVMLTPNLCDQVQKFRWFSF